jgi:hypothetical protein
MVVALILQTITLASGDYRTVLVVGLVLSFIADICFIAAFGPVGSTLRQHCIDVAHSVCRC